MRFQAAFAGVLQQYIAAGKQSKQDKQSKQKPAGKGPGPKHGGAKGRVTATAISARLNSPGMLTERLLVLEQKGGLVDLGSGAAATGVASLQKFLQKAHSGGRAALDLPGFRAGEDAVADDDEDEDSSDDEDDSSDEEDDSSDDDDDDQEEVEEEVERIPVVPKHTWKTAGPTGRFDR